MSYYAFNFLHYTIGKNILYIIALIVLYILFFRYKSKANYKIDRLKIEVDHLKSLINLDISKNVDVTTVAHSEEYRAERKDEVATSEESPLGAEPIRDSAYAEADGLKVGSHQIEDFVPEQTPDYMKASYGVNPDIKADVATWAPSRATGGSASQQMLARRRPQQSAAAGLGAQPSTSSTLVDGADKSSDGVYASTVNFIKGGNIWVLIGTIFVLLGLTFSYRYISKIYEIPDIFRVIAGIMISVAVFAVGWRQRIEKSRRVFSLIMQGGGIALISFTIFAAAKYYYIIDSTVAIVLISIVLIIGFVISILENSQLFAVVIAVISFATPLLLSTGSNNYIGLFSYYVIIVSGILFIATKRSWRYLNSIAVLCVSGVALAWGSRYFYASEPLYLEVFLIIFFLLFNVITILSALRKPSQKVETTVAVTVSFISASMQFYIVNSILYISNYQDVAIYNFLVKHGLALSSFIIGLFYLIFSIVLGKRYREKIPALVSVYLALGILFINMTIPFLTKGFWLPMIWAIEGVVLLVLGVRQDNRTFRLFGIVLGVFASMQALSNYYVYVREVKYYGGYYGVDGAIHLVRGFINSFWICVAVSSMALLVSTMYLRRLQHVLYRLASYFVVILSYFSVVIATLYELNVIVDKGIRMPTAFLMVLSITSLIYAFAGRRANWSFLEPIKYLPALFTCILIFNLFSWISWLSYSIFSLSAQFPYNGVAMLIFCITQVILIFYLSINVQDSSALHTSVGDTERHFKYQLNRINYAWVAAFFIVLLYFLTLNISDIMLNIFEIQYISYFSIVFSVLIIVAILIPDRYLSFNHYPSAFKKWAIWALAVCVIVQFINYDILNNWIVLTWAQLIPYMLLLPLLSFNVWYLFARSGKVPNLEIKSGGWHDYLTKAIIGIFWFTTAHILVARFVTLVENVDYSVNVYFSLPLYQLLIAILWAVVGFALMFAGNRAYKRVLWTLGALLLSCDILKVMTIDLSNAGTLPRIGSFLGVGVLLIVIGYFVPLPPKMKSTRDNGEDNVRVS